MAVKLNFGLGLENIDDQTKNKQALLLKETIFTYNTVHFSFKSSFTEAIQPILSDEIY